MSLSVDFSAWQVQRKGNGRSTTDILGGDRSGIEISRIYDYSDGQTAKKTATIRIDCRLEQGFGGFSVNSFFSMYFKPFRVPEDTPFVMGLLTPDYGGNFVMVTARPLEGDPDTSLLFASGKEDADKCIGALLAGKHLSFTLMQIEPKENLVKLPIPNDGEFKRLYDKAYNRLAHGEDASPVEPSSPDIIAEVRKNPKDFAVWMVEMQPGEYGVLLVKLDNAGRMADAWNLGKPFSDRTEQGSFALQAARDLQIKLMDVVKQ